MPRTALQDFHIFPPMKHALRWLLPVAVLGYLFTGLAKVDPGERAVVRRFGQIVAHPGPGLWVGLPWGLDRIDRVQVRAARQLSVGYNPDDANDAPGVVPGQFLTGDQNLVQARFVVEYVIDEQDSGLDQYLLHRDSLDRTLTSETEAVAGSWFATQPIDAALSGRVALARALTDRLSLRTETLQLGILLQRVTIDILAAPESVRESFEAVNQAQTSIRTRRNVAEQEATRQRNEAETLRARLLGEAGSYKLEREALAKSEAAAFLVRLEQYQRLRVTNPNVLQAIWRDEMTRMLAGVKERGRIEVLDDALGPNGIELNQFIPTKGK